MTDQIDVRIKAHTGELKPGMDDAARSVQDASTKMREAMRTTADRMRDAFGQMKDAAKGAGSGMAEPISAAREQMRDAALGMTGSLSGVVQAMQALPGPAKAAAIALVGLFAAKQFAEGAAETIESTMDLARVLGSSTNVAQKWRVALDDVGASQSDLEGAAKGLSRQLRENEDELNALGLSTRDASGNLRPMNDLISDGIGILNEYKEGADRAQVAQTVFGRGVDASSKLLLINSETLEGAQETMEGFSLEVGANAVAAWKEFDGASDKAAAGMKGIGYTIGSIVMPINTDLINALSSLIPAAITILRGALGGLATAFHAVKMGVIVVWETINAMVVTVAEPIRALSEAIGRAVTGDFEGAAAAIKGVGDVISNQWSSAMDSMADSAQRTSDRIGAIWNPDTAAGEPEGERGTKGAPTKKDKEKKAAGPAKAEKEPSFMGTYEAVLAERRVAYAKENGLREMSKAEELAYWNEILSTYSVGSKDRTSILKKSADLELAVMRERAKEGRDLSLIDIDEARKSAMSKLQLAEESAKAQAAMGQITSGDLLRVQADFNRQRYDLEMSALQERILLAQTDPNSNPVEFEKLQNQKLEILRNFEAQRQAIQIQADIESNARNANMVAGIQASMQQITASLMQGTFTWRGALNAVFSQIGQAATKTISTMATNWIKGLLQMQAQEKAMSLASIHANAMKAGAAAYQAIVGIPYVGPILAPAAAAVAYAGTMAFASAEGGYDIPANVNPMVQAHAEEMILPKEQANVIRDLAEGGGGGSGGLVINASPMPGGFFAVHQDEFVRFYDRLKRNRYI